MGYRHNLADNTEIEFSASKTIQREEFTPLPKTTTSRVTTTRPSYSFGKASSTNKPSTASRPRSSSPKKKTAAQELASYSHQKAHLEAISTHSKFRSKTSLTPQSAQLLDSFNNTPTSPIHALNFTAASKVYPAATSSSIVHATGEFQPKATTTEIPSPLPGNHRSIDTIMETDGETISGYRLGMENGFENSPMAGLLRQFSSDDIESQGLSTEMKIQLIIDVVELGPEMIVDRGPEREDGIPRYHLALNDLDRARDTVTELQIFLQRAANLIPERRTHFLVDPGDTLLPMLAGTSSLGQLNAAWKALRLRVELGVKAWKKYITEYQHPSDHNLVLSPISTLPDLYNDLDRIDSKDQRLRYMYTNIPHHKDQLTEEGQISLQRARSSWVHILPIPASIRSAFRLDEKPTPIPTPVSRPTDLPLQVASKGKQKEEGSMQAKGKGRDSTIPEKRDNPQPSAGTSIWMGSDTPFKSANAWFVEPGKSNRPCQEGTSKQPPPSQDILLGIATPQADAPTTSKTDWRGRETPPHMTSQGQVHNPDKRESKRESNIEPRSRDSSLAERNVQYRRKHPQQTEVRDEDGGPPDDDDDDDTIHSSRSSRRGRRRRRSRTPRPRRRRSSTLRPRRHRDSDDDGGGGSSNDSSNNSFSSSSSSRSHSSYSLSSTSRRRKRHGGNDDVIIPYGTIPPTIKSELKQEDLPAWDGNPKTAIAYFWRVQERATLGGYIPQALGYWLWLKLEEGSDVQSWFSTLPSQEQAKMRGHWVDYLKGIKEGYLGRNWQFDIGEEYKAQAFREPGHENELPKTFIARRIMYTRMLVRSDNGGPLEVHLVMARAPLSWRTILVLENIKSTSLLYTKAVEHQEALLNISRDKPSSTITTDNLVTTLRRMGYVLQKPSFGHNFPSNRRANLSMNEIEPSPGSSSDELKESYMAASAGETSDQGINKAEDQILSEAYQVMKRRQRLPPPGGYMFGKNDHVTTKMGRLPPSPCKCCGSANHWDKECPDWAVYQERTAKSGYRNEFGMDKDDEPYQSAYGILLSQRVASMQVDESKISQGFETAIQQDRLTPISAECKSVEPAKSAANVAVEEIEDEFWEEERQKPKATSHILFHVDEEVELEGEAKTPPQTKHPTKPVTIEEVEDEEWEAHRNRPKSPKHILIAAGELDDPPENQPSTSLQNSDPITNVSEALAAESTVKTDTLPESNTATTSLPPPTQDKPVRLQKKRFTPSGTSALGVSVLSTKGWVGNLDNDPVDLRLDSCADVTLISEEFFRSLKGAPKEKQGMRMQLWQLTDKDSSLKGFVRIPIIMQSEDGILLESEAEAYIVPGMTVPILLGEDYQLNYELGVTRNVELGTRVSFAGTDFQVLAQRVDRMADFDRMRQSAMLAGHFIRSKLHRRAKAKRHRRKVKFGLEEKTVRAAEDVCLRPHECKRIRVEGQLGELGEDRERLVQKNLLANANDSHFAVPNTLISARNPWVPVANPTDQPRYVRRGEVIGILEDPAQFFETPVTPERKDVLTKHAAAISEIIKIQLEDGQPHPTNSDPMHKPSHTSEQEDYGPKTAAMPDLTEYPSSRMEEFIDVGSLPEHLKEKAWEMLHRRQRAFGFDGRLGHLPTKVHIRTVDGQVPIAVPMYGSSPEKRRVMDEQIDKWFEQGVIEPSISPWSAPVVIAYRNGKPRFCVDYRKLNAATIPDEFPIPRQSEILSSLSGAQVLSSLDALSGFTQLELDPDDIEKTAFRTHRGLFQFRRMPFGLRNGPSIFQRVMQGILAPYLWIFCLVYIDDIVVYSKSYEEHIGHLDKVLEAIEKAGITLSPSKCHLFYGSILLLGHKVSRLGLSTHEEKVRAITELDHPRKLSQLQTFLGMVVYFSAFIPFYTSICTPLFQLLRKGCKWKWGAEEEYAFAAAKEALRKSPVLGHPIEGKPYRLYTDASDEALGCALQQVQPIQVKDLKGTRAYDRLKKAFEKGLPPPKLTASLSSKTSDSPSDDKWGNNLDSTTVHVERVIGYWSRTFKSAETRYSTTEREALAAKEGLVKFQPYIEGEKILLVTDHSALQWARTYENANRRLAAWGAVFSAYSPGLEIIHRAGRVHSNVDPLSRLPRAPPDHISPLKDSSLTILTDSSLAEEQERQLNSSPAKEAFVIWSVDECLEGIGSAWGLQGERNDIEDEHSLDTLPVGDEYWDASNPAPNLHVSMDPDFLQSWVSDYEDDRSFSKICADKKHLAADWKGNGRFLKDERGLLFFLDNNYQPRLCVPEKKRNFVLKEAHENPLESAHAGAERLWQTLSQKYYWKRMKVDIINYCRTCDICQKIKTTNFNKFGYLIPNPIPSRPYQSISMDFIVNLPWSNGFNAIFVVVDRLTKQGSFIPCTTGLTAEEFAELFVKHIVCRFGLPDSIITDRDPRWTSDFWRGIAYFLKTKMSLSSAHHPQHDGQTEILNRHLTTMLRAYISDDLSDWSAWLHILEFAYNNTLHSSTGASPNFLTYSFQPKTPLDFLLPAETQEGKDHSYSLNPAAKGFLETLAMHRDSAKRSIAKAQDEQSLQYNKGRRAVPEFKQGDRVLVNPHTLDWIDSKGTGAKLKQRWIGPFEVTQVINPKVFRLRMSDKYLGFPVFNIEHLKKYHESAPEMGERTVMPESRRTQVESQEYEVEDIVGHRRSGKALQYLVRWLGYGPQYDTWEPARGLRNATTLVRKYRERCNL